MYPHLAQHNVELVAVCDLIKEKARKAQEQYGFGKVYTDFREMCDREALDAVFCVGPYRMHYSVGKEVLERGRPLYVQKPPAANGQQAQEMADLAKRQGVVMHVGFTLRFSVAFQQMKRRMETEEFGRPTLCIVRYLVRGGELRAAAIDMNSHAVDAARFFMGDIKELKVAAGRQEGVRNYVATVVFESGGVGTLNFTSELTREICYFEVTGEKGHLLTCHGLNPRYQTPDGVGGGELIGELGENEGPHHASGSFGDVENFLNAIRGVAPDISSIDSAARTMQAVDEIIAQVEASSVMT